MPWDVCKTTVVGITIIHKIKTMNNIDSLLAKPIWQMNGAEFCALTQYANAQSGHGPAAPGTVRITGVRALAEYLECCDSTVYMLKRNGVLDEAILSQVGKRIVFDGELARAAADRFQKEKRHEK